MNGGLSRTILLPTLAILAIGLIAVLVMEHLNARSILREELSKRLDREVTLSAKLIDSWLQARMIDLNTWSRQSILAEALTREEISGHSDRVAARALLANLKSGYQQYESLFLADRQGAIVAIAPPAEPASPAVHLADHPYFQQALQGTTVISDAIVSRFSRHKTFTVAAPVTAGGTVVGVLGGVIDFAMFKTLFLDDFRIKQHGYAFVADSRHQILSSSHANESDLSASRYEPVLRRIAEAHRGMFTHALADSQILTTFQHLERTDWVFVIDQSLDHTLLALNQAFQINTAGAILILVVLSAMIVFLFRRRIVQRLQDILRVTMTVRRGDFSQRITNAPGCSDEISELTESFNSMIDRLDRTVGDLNDEIRVRRQTEADLAHHQANLEKIIALRSSELQKEIGERLKAEERLGRAEKLEMIGTLAGGVAHDLNNILSGIVSYPDLLLMKLPADSPLQPALRTIKESGEKAAAIVQDLLTLARRGVTVREPVNLNKLITNYLASPEFHLLQSHHPAMRIYTDCAPDLFNILGSPVHLAKTIMNLIANGAEAMDQGGEIHIRTENRYVDSSLRGYEKISQGDYVVLEIKDQGCGIGEEDLDKIFEPFYTSKKMGKSGTGLGMAVVWGTVKDHDGSIDCASTLGIGTTFTLYFPVTTQHQIHQLRDDEREEYQGRGEHILVVDDIGEQREIAATILTELGYRVSTVASGEEAVQMAGEQQFDLLLLDMILGEGMDGLDTYRRIIEQTPGQAAIITSGFSETDRIAEAIRLGVGQYIKKPYMISRLGMAIRNELARS
jgi:C4-dicarboxylate-specific signal transduction histidine kinase/CheY-like chemotaxis protein